MQAKVGDRPVVIKNGASSINVFKSVIEAMLGSITPQTSEKGAFSITTSARSFSFFDDRRKEGTEQAPFSTKAEFPTFNAWNNS